jgi:(E)-4-hydroxy-3-methylbut-2-enyl-diphosphate synthase
MHRNNTKEITIGDKKIGGGNPILIQSMTNTKTQDIEGTIAQIKALTIAGCDIIRLAVPDWSLQSFEMIKENTKIPVCCGYFIFDYRLAIAAIEHGADKIRINPGNIGDDQKLY